MARRCGGAETVAFVYALETRPDTGRARTRRRFCIALLRSLRRLAAPTARAARGTEASRRHDRATWLANGFALLVLAFSVAVTIMSGAAHLSNAAWAWVPWVIGGICAMGLYFIAASLAGVRWLPLPGFGDADLPGNRRLLLALAFCASVVALFATRPAPAPAIAPLPPQLPLSRTVALLRADLECIRKDTGETKRLRLSSAVAALGPTRYPALWAGALVALEHRRAVTNVASIPYDWTAKGVGWSENETVDYSFDIVGATMQRRSDPCPVVAP